MQTSSRLHLQATAALSGFFVDLDAEAGVTIQFNSAVGPITLRFVGYTDGEGMDNELVDSDLFCTAALDIPESIVDDFVEFWEKITNTDPRAMFSHEIDWITSENPFDLRQSPFSPMLKKLHYSIDSIPEMSVPEPQAWPENVVSLVQSAYRALQVEVLRLISKVQWIQAQTLVSSSLVYWSNEAWSIDGVNWKFLPFYKQEDNWINPTGKPLNEEDITALIHRASQLGEAPLSFELLGEATSLAQNQPHLAYIVAVSACEVRASEVCTQLGGLYQWLSSKRNPPSVIEFATAIFPMILAERGVQVKGQAIPHEIIKRLRAAIKDRNDIVHRGSLISDEDEGSVWSTLKHVKDYLYLTYYYMGHEWASEGLSEASQLYLKRNLIAGPFKG